MEQDDRLLTTKEAADLIGIKANTLVIWRRLDKTDKRYIPCLKIGRNVRYRRSDVLTYLYRQRN